MAAAGFKRRERKEEYVQRNLVALLRREKIIFRAGLEGVPLQPNWGLIKKLVALGMRAGWPDLHFPLHRLWVELKCDDGVTSADQKEVHEALRAAGDRVETIKTDNYWEAWKILTKLLGEANRNG